MKASIRAGLRGRISDMWAGKLRAFCLAGTLAALTLPVLGYALEARVQRVVDGRTIVLSNGERVRYIGVEIPDDLQSVTEATNMNRNLVEGADVRLEFDRHLRDKEGNLLAYVYVGDLMVNEYLIHTGQARVESYSANRRFLTRMLHLQAKASRERLGIWSRATGEAAPVPEMEEEPELGEGEWEIEGVELPVGEVKVPEPEVTVPSVPEGEGGKVVIEGE